MPVKVLTDAFVYVDLYDFTGDSNTARISCEARVENITNFRSAGWTENTMTLKSSTLDASGFWSQGVDAVYFPNLGTQYVHTVGPSEEEGGRCQIWQAANFTGPLFGPEVGGVAPYAIASQGTDGVGIVSAKLIKEMATVSATGATGAEVQLGAVSATQYLYASFHVFTAGTTITAVLESDSDDTFGSATTRITFGPYTTTGARWATRVAGPITDTWYRLNVTTCTGSFVIACAAGIQ
jgi:hypothetical protein